MATLILDASRVSWLNVPETVSTLVPFMDMAGLMVYGGRERTKQDLGDLLARHGFKLQERTWPLPGRQIIYEAIAV